LLPQRGPPICCRPVNRSPPNPRGKTSYHIICRVFLDFSNCNHRYLSAKIRAGRDARRTPGALEGLTFKPSEDDGRYRADFCRRRNCSGWPYRFGADKQRPPEHSVSGKWIGCLGDCRKRSRYHSDLVSASSRSDSQNTLLHCRSSTPAFATSVP
jgi:hypothetical protein